MTTRLACALLLSLGLSNVATAADQSATGPAVAHDGDDLIINGTDYRLSGIDAFELNQTCRDSAKPDVACGTMAHDALAGLVARKQVTCKDTGDRANGRVVAICAAADLDLQEQMVRIGWAFVRPDYAGNRTTRLCALEAEAAGAHRGGWKLTFELPYFFKGGKNKTRAQVSCGHV